MTEEETQVTYSYLKSKILKFVEIINAGDSNRLMAMQTDDFTFIDKLGDVFVGKDGWEEYFTSYPKYKIHVKSIVTSGSGVAIIGTTTDSHVLPELEKHETCLWIAEIRDGLVSKWRIYSDIDDIKERHVKNEKE